MAYIPKKIASRLSTSLKRFQPILESAKARDINESDTVVIVADILSEMFGYDKYNEITSEYAIRGTYCDLAIKIDGKVHYIIEVKAIGSDLKDNHVRQAVDYAANEGIDWVMLTNAINWRVFRISFTKPISHEEVVELDLTSLNPKRGSDIESLYLLTKKGIKKSALSEYQIQAQATNRFFLGAIILTDPIIHSIRRELKRLNPGIKIETTEIKGTLRQEVLKREVVEGEHADEAGKRVRKAMSKALKKKKPKEVQVTEKPQL
ncbi:type I restriction enzyme HsdR N-terminal domain-containing protein [Acidobacteria bacterium AH-259-A15]|nr:type I restriction enzyme HsdR N-terminal domain-containing protein [Acidobacteria bacterium AH-259-A15]